MKKRIEYFDIAKAICIILMIVGHSLPQDSILRRYIYTFHMPLFFIVSGYFFKQKGKLSCAKSSFINLILPYLYTGGTILALKTLIAIIQHKDATQVLLNWTKIILYGAGEKETFLGNDIEAIGAIWFLLSLFWTKNIFNAISFMKNETIKRIIITILMIVGFILPNYIWLPLSIETSFIAITFFYIGYMMNKYNIFDKKIKMKRKNILLLIIIWGIIGYFCNTSMARNIYNLYIINIVEGVMGSIIIIYFSQKIENEIKKRKIIKWMGENSLYILCCHCLEGKRIIPWRKVIPTKGIFTNIICRLFFSIMPALIIAKIVKKESKQIEIRKKHEERE